MEMGIATWPISADQAEIIKKLFFVDEGKTVT